MKKHLCQEIYDNSVKKGSLWYLRWDHSLLIHPQLGKAETPLRTGGAKDTGLPLSQLPVGGLFPWRSQTSAFCLNSPVLRPSSERV